MPTYEYRGPEGHSFERFYRKISDAAPELACPQCGKVATRQLTGGAGLVFKGSGFYLTDYGKNAHRKGGPAAKASEAGDKAGEGGSPESGSAAGAESAIGADKPASGASAESTSKTGTTSAPKETKPKSDK
jgi:putative FmdB family regulatory protein